MRKYTLLDSLNSLDNLELRLSPSALAGSAVAPPIVTAPANPGVQSDDDDDDDDGGGNGDGDNDGDPLPDPEPEPGPDPGNDPPIVYPILPPSGPSGPGS